MEHDGRAAATALTTDRTHIDARVDVRASSPRRSDYRWEIEGSVRSDVQVRPAVGLLFTGTLRRLGVDETRNRGDQPGFAAKPACVSRGGREQWSSFSPVSAVSIHPLCSSARSIGCRSAFAC